MSKLARRHRRRKFKKNPSSSPRRNPPIGSDIIHWVVPGFGGFVASRALTRLSQQLIAKRFPKASKHAGAVSAVAAFLASWFAGHKVKLVEKYHTPITVGAAIAAGQTLLQIYAPNLLGWLVSDATPQIVAAQTAQQIAAANAQKQLPDDFEEIDDDPRWYTYNDAYDSGRYGTLSKGTSWQPEIGATNAPEANIADVQAGDEEAAAGIFGS